MIKIAHSISRYLNRYALYGLIGWVISISILYSLLSLIRHTHFQSGAFDLGIFDQSVWQYAHGIYPYNTIKERFILGDHLSLTMPLLAPFFYLWDDVRMLLILQAVWLSVSSIAIYKIARIRDFSSFVSLCLSIIYSLFYGIQFGIFFDFHSVMIGVGLLPWVAYFLESRQQKRLLIAVILLLLSVENMGIALACLGYIYIWKKEFRKISIFFIGGGILSSLAAMKAVAFFSPIGYQYAPQISHNPLQIVSDFFNAQEKQQVWIYSLSWFAFLPIFSPGAMMAVFFDLAQYFVTGSDFQRMWSPFMHHRAILGIFLVLGTMQTLEFLKKKKISLDIVAFGMVLLVMGLQFYFHFPLNKLSKSEFVKNESWMDDNRALFQFIPKTASIAATQNLVPHLSHRKEIYLLWPHLKHDHKLCGATDCWWLDFAGMPEYVIVDLHPNQWVTQLLESNENFSQAIKNMEKNKKIVVVKQVGEARMYKVNY